MFRLFEIVIKSTIVCFLFMGCSSPSKIEQDKRYPSSIDLLHSPRLFIQPAPIFDMLCQQTPFKIDSEIQNKYRAELNEKLNLFQNEWDKAADVLILESEKAAGRKFDRKEYSVALALCTWTPMGDPVFLVSAGPYLGGPRKANGFDLPMSMTAFVSMTHHELLHSLVQNFIDPIVKGDPKVSSPLLDKYGSPPYSESFNVLVHLHLMAVQKAAYQNLKNDFLMKETNMLYSFIGGDYKKAWEIVSTEGTEPFLKELRNFNSQVK